MAKKMSKVVTKETENNTTLTSVDPGPLNDAKSTRTKINERLDRAVSRSPPTKNRSPELVPLTAEYEKMRKNCR